MKGLKKIIYHCLNLSKALKYIIILISFQKNIVKPTGQFKLKRSAWTKTMPVRILITMFFSWNKMYFIEHWLTDIDKVE